ncbi:hypothetical protein [Sphingobacterium sp. LRF_L2]|uniref:hypothetical protein n=1 Tax=Sphingobacterium sp. LRF_L2 TaxID=3369421 RepID=UPI003F606FB8
MKNNIIVGIVIGVLPPFFAYLLTAHTDFANELFPTKPFILYVLAAAINLILIRVFYKKTAEGKEKIAQGIVMVTFVGMLLFLYFYKINM